MDKEEIIERLKRLEKEKDELEEKYEKVNQENQRLREIIEEKTGTKNSADNSNENVSRRAFLKKLSAGAIGLGAISIAPAASQLKLTKNGIQNAQSINTGDLQMSKTIGEIGVVDHGSVGSGSTSSVTVSFTDSYSTPPHVLHGVGMRGNASVSGSPQTTVVADQVTTTDFRSYAYNGAGSSQDIDKCVYIVVVD